MSGRWNLRPAPAFKYHPLLRAGKCRDTYELAHAAWRAGALSDFRYGARTDDDPTLIWTIGTTEYAKGDTAGVSTSVRRRLAACGIANVTLGATWCGYRECIVTYSSGARAVQRYDGTTGRIVIDDLPAQREEIAS